MIQQVTQNYSEAIHTIKQAVLKSRYNAAVPVNREMLMFYFGIGEFKPEYAGKLNSTCRLSKELPPEYQGILPDANKLPEVLENDRSASESE